MAGIFARKSLVPLLTALSSGKVERKAISRDSLLASRACDDDDDSVEAFAFRRE